MHVDQCFLCIFALPVKESIFNTSFGHDFEMYCLHVDAYLKDFLHNLFLFLVWLVLFWFLLLSTQPPPNGKILKVLSEL